MSTAALDPTRRWCDDDLREAWEDGARPGRAGWKAWQAPAGTAVGDLLAMIADRHGLDFPDAPWFDDSATADRIRSDKIARRKAAR